SRGWTRYHTGTVPLCSTSGSTVLIVLTSMRSALPGPLAGGVGGRPAERSARFLVPFLRRSDAGLARGWDGAAMQDEPGVHDGIGERRPAPAVHREVDDASVVAPAVDIVVPVYNEEAEIEAHVTRLHDFL